MSSCCTQIPPPIPKSPPKADICFKKMKPKRTPEMQGMAGVPAAARRPLLATTRSGRLTAGPRPPTAAQGSGDRYVRTLGWETGESSRTDVRLVGTESRRLALHPSGS